MKRIIKAYGIALSLMLSLNVFAQNEIFQKGFKTIEIGPDSKLLSYYTTLSLLNSTDSSVTFVLGPNHCVVDAPASFTVEAHSTWSHTFTQKHWDTGLDNCYGSNHILIYQHSKNPNTRFGIEQSNSSNDWVCLGIKIFVVFQLGQAICPVATGKIKGPTARPSRDGLGTYVTCPDGTGDCRDQWGRQMKFGFLLPSTSVVIGSQTWMSENLGVSTYRNGDPIRFAENDSAWQAANNEKEGAWCYYLNDTKNGALYGKLYNGYAVTDPRGLAPKGWHIPTQKEWTTLIDYLGGNKAAVSKMTEVAIPNVNCTNSSGFFALPAGFRGPRGFERLGNWAKWHSSIVESPGAGEIYMKFNCLRNIPGTCGMVSPATNNKNEYGSSVRVVKDIN